MDNHKMTTFQPPGPGSLTHLQANFLSLLFASTYVGSLYISKKSRLSFSRSPIARGQVHNLHEANTFNNNNETELEPRTKQRNERWSDDDDVIRARLAVCATSTLLCCMIVVWVHWLLLSLPIGDSLEDTRYSLSRLFDAFKLSLTRLGLIPHLSSSLKPHLLAPVLFTGPLCSMYLSQTLPYQQNWSYQRDVLLKFFSWQGKRNYIFAPITEELVFRACVLAVYYLAGLERNKMLFLTPLTFGLAHVHHGWETFNLYGRNRAAAKRVILVTCIQLTYTTLFGTFCAYLFLRTGSIYPTISAHAFCNLMGLPGMFEEMRTFSSRKYLILAAYVVGIYGFVTRLGPWTSEGGSVYWN